MEPLNNVDVVILIGFVISMLIAFIRGFVKETLSILGLALFVVAVLYLSPLLLPFFNKYIASQVLAQVVIFIVIMVVFYTIWIFGTDRLISRIRTSTLSFMDRLFGLIFGFLRALFLLGFCFLILKIILPEKIEKGAIKESKFFVVSQTTSDLIEKALPEKYINDTIKMIEDMNKVENKEEKEDEKEKKNLKNIDKKTDNIPSKLDQKQMDKVFEQLIEPEVKRTTNSVKKENKSGYNSNDTKNLDRLVDITIKE